MEGWKKGMTYGTVIVDLERRRVVDVLADRSADSLIARPCSTGSRSYTTPM
jgi:transposase